CPAPLRAAQPRRPQPLGRQHQQLYDRARHRSPGRALPPALPGGDAARRSDFLMRVRQADEDGAAAASDDYDVRRELEQLLDAEIAAAAAALKIEAAMRRELSQCGCVCPPAAVASCGFSAPRGPPARLRLRPPCPPAGQLLRSRADLGDLRESLLDCASAHASLCTEDTAVLVVDDGQGGDSLIAQRQIYAAKKGGGVSATQKQPSGSAFSARFLSGKAVAGSSCLPLPQPPANHRPACIISRIPDGGGLRLFPCTRAAASSQRPKNRSSITAAAIRLPLGGLGSWPRLRSSPLSLAPTVEPKRIETGPKAGAVGKVGGLQAASRPATDATQRSRHRSQRRTKTGTESPPVAQRRCAGAAPGAAAVSGQDSATVYGRALRYERRRPLAARTRSATDEDSRGEIFRASTGDDFFVVAPQCSAGALAQAEMPLPWPPGPRVQLAAASVNSVLQMPSPRARWPSAPACRRQPFWLRDLPESVPGFPAFIQSQCWRRSCLVPLSAWVNLCLKNPGWSKRLPFCLSATNLRACLHTDYSTLLSPTGRPRDRCLLRGSPTPYQSKPFALEAAESLLVQSTLD
uniref:UVR domain-containing protein n=1 Tax=Macrostomum lignano TaxID=282301 RepID=A0A1I8F387_9PLAT